jgi:hypothetical protein
MKAVLNIPSIKKKVYGSKITKKRVFEIVSNKVEKNKEFFISEFENHPVTVEISSGPSASNISNTLGGKGNLFSFIGFSRSDRNPTSVVVDLIKKIRTLKKIDSTKKGFLAKVRVTGLEEFGSATRMPWESGRSWLLDIEKRISGLGNYLYGKFNDSRSGTGIQSKVNIFTGQFRPVKYFQQMYITFIQNIKRK